MLLVGVYLHTVWHFFPSNMQGWVLGFEFFYKRKSNFFRSTRGRLSTSLYIREAQLRILRINCQKARILSKAARGEQYFGIVEVQYFTQDRSKNGISWKRRECCGDRQGEFLSHVRWFSTYTWNMILFFSENFLITSYHAIRISISMIYI